MVYVLSVKVQKAFLTSDIRICGKIESYNCQVNIYTVACLYMGLAVSLYSNSIGRCMLLKVGAWKIVLCWFDFVTSSSCHCGHVLIHIPVNCYRGPITSALSVSLWLTIKLNGSTRRRLHTECGMIRLNKAWVSIAFISAIHQSRWFTVLLWHSIRHCLAVNCVN